MACLRRGLSCLGAALISVLQASAYRASIPTQVSPLDADADLEGDPPSNSSVLSLLERQADLHSCPAGDIDPQCRSMCRWLWLTTSQSNGACTEFVNEVKALGYSARTFWKFYRSSTLDPVIQALSENAREASVPFYIATLKNILSTMPDKKQQKYKTALVKLSAGIEAWVSANPRFAGASHVRPQEEADGSSEPLPICTGGFEAGDIVTFQVGGPDFAEMSGALSEFAAEGEALQLRRHFDYRKHFDYGEHFVSYDGPAYKRYSKRIADFFANAGKGIADVAINVGKGLVDMTANVGKLLGKGFVYTGAGITATYASVRQTTSHTGSTKWTHTEIATGPNTLLSAYGDVGVSEHSACYLHETKLVVSRFQGDGLVDAASYQKLAAYRAKMWSQQLNHYADTIGQWHHVIFGKCLNAIGNAGREEYWKAVTDSETQNMWDYNPTAEMSDAGFWEGVKNSFRTHKDDARVKPKAMFCSKLVTALWSSTIGNPSEHPQSAVRHADVNKMFPFNPGACSPWTVVQWLTGSKGRKYWKSCVADTNSWQPCR